MKEERGEALQLCAGSAPVTPYYTWVRGGINYWSTSPSVTDTDLGSRSTRGTDNGTEADVGIHEGWLSGYHAASLPYHV